MKSLFLSFNIPNNNTSYVLIFSHIVAFET